MFAQEDRAQEVPFWKLQSDCGSQSWISQYQGRLLPPCFSAQAGADAGPTRIASFSIVARGHSLTIMARRELLGARHLQRAAGFTRTFTCAFDQQH